VPVLLLLFAITAVAAGSAEARQFDDHRTVEVLYAESLQPKDGGMASPRGAFFRSLVLPGWGHYYTGSEHAGRGRFHTGADLALFGAGVGVTVQSNRIERNYITYTRLHAGVDLAERGRAFRLAVGDFQSLDAYNDYQLRTRSWHRIIEDTPENRWDWAAEEDRRNYREMRSRSDRYRNQVPAIAAMMVLNRVISAISAYNRAREGSLNRTEVALSPVFVPEADLAHDIRPYRLGWMGQLNVRF
jgi:hypothetical protein